MSKQKPSAWQECRAIAASAMQPEDHEQDMQRARAMLLAQIAAGSEKGAALAARLANADGPIEVADEDVPEELLQQMRPASNRCISSSLPGREHRKAQ